MESPGPFIVSFGHVENNASSSSSSDTATAAKLQQQRNLQLIRVLVPASSPLVTAPSGVGDSVDYCVVTQKNRGLPLRLLYPTIVARCVR